MTVAEKIAREVAAEVRMFVRDRFTPGSLSSLDELAKLVEEKVRAAGDELRGKFECCECSKSLDVEWVRCNDCAAHQTEH